MDGWYNSNGEGDSDGSLLRQLGSLLCSVTADPPVKTENRFEALDDEAMKPKDLDEWPIVNAAEGIGPSPSAGASGRLKGPRVRKWKKMGNICTSSDEEDHKLLDAAIEENKQAPNSGLSANSARPMREMKLSDEVSDQLIDVLAGIMANENDHGETNSTQCCNHGPTASDQYLGCLTTGGEETATKGLNAVAGVSATGWTSVLSIVDSGAIESVAPMSCLPNVPTKESKGSMEGQTYYSADGTALPNKGEKSFSAWTDCGQAVGQTFQIADITKPLLSVGKLANNSNLVLFGKRGGLHPQLAGQVLDLLPSGTWGVHYAYVGPE